MQPFPDAAPSAGPALALPLSSSVAGRLSGIVPGPGAIRV